jgi:hypothetical protein
MALSDRSRAHGIAAAQVLLPGSEVRAYLVGRAQARWSNGAIIAAAIFGVVFLVGLAAGTVVYPGGLLVLYFIHALRPPRAIAVTDDQFVLLSRSFLNGRPSTLLATAPLSAPQNYGADGMIQHLIIGPDRVTLPRRERERLAVIRTAPPASELSTP